jgi:hypothetical protein
MDELQEYDNKFSLYDIAKAKPKAQLYRSNQTGSTEVARNTKFGESTFDEDFFPDIAVNWGGGDSLDQVIDENRAQNQPWITKFGAGFARTGGKVVAEIAKMPGVLGGIAVATTGQVQDWRSGEDNTDFMQVAFNNGFIKAIEGAEEAFNSEVVPVYVKKAVREGNLFDKISSIDFWATEGADGLGYIISMLAPGQAITSLKAGSLLARGVKGVGTKLGKVAKMTASVEKATANLTKLGFTPRNLDLGLAGMANTVFEAGAEARGAMDGYEEEINYRMSLPADHEDYIAPEEEQAYRAKISEVGANVFKANAAILLVPNLIMAKLIWGKPKYKPTYDPITKQLVAQANPTLLKGIKTWGDDFAKGALREGFWEEGMQTTAENYFTKNPDSNWTDVFTQGLPEYLRTLGSTDGQTAIFLGAVFGGPMQASMNMYNEKKQRTATNSLIGSGNTAINDYANFLGGEDIQMMDSKGKPMWEKNSEGVLVKVLDPKKVKEKFQSTDGLHKLSAIHEMAMATGNTELMEEVESIMYTDLVKPFVMNQTLGVEALKAALYSNAELAKATEGINVDTETIVKNIVKKAQYLRKKYENFEEFGNALIQPTNKDSKDHDRETFLRGVANHYVHMHSRRQDLAEKKSKKEALLDELLEEKGRTRSDLSFTEDDTSGNALLSRDLLQDTRVKRLHDQLMSINKSLEQTDKQIEDIWNKKKQQDAFAAFVKDARDLDARLEKEKEVEEVLTAISNATTKEELDKIDLSHIDEETQTILKEARESRLEELEEEEKAAIEKAKNKADKAKTKAEKKAELATLQLQFIEENYNVGDIVTVPDWVAELGNDKAKPHAGKTATVTKVGKQSISLVTEENEAFTISKKELFKQESNVSSMTGIEGSVETSHMTEETREANAQHDHSIEDRTDSVVMSKNASNDFKPFEGVDPAMIEFEENPIDKVKNPATKGGKQTNKTVGFEIDRQIDRSRNRERNELITKSKALNAEYEALDEYETDKAITKLKNNLKRSTKPETIARTEMLIAKQQGVLNRITEIVVELEAIDKKIDSIKEDMDANPATLQGTITDNQAKALQIFKDGDFEGDNIDFLINYLPLATKFTANVSGKLHTRSDKEGAGKFNKIWEKTTKNLRTAIIMEMVIEKTPIEKIRTEIVGQKNGSLIIADKVNGQVVENNINDLHHFKGKKITTKDIFVVNKMGVLENALKPKTGKVFLKRKLAKGEVYAKIATAAGKDFYLKLNVKKTSVEEAELLYEVYKYRFQEEAVSPEDGGARGVLIKDTTPELYAKLKEEFAKQIELIGKPAEDVTVRDVINFFIYDNSTSKKSQVRFYTKQRNEEDKEKTRLLFVGTEEFNAEEFASPEGKKQFITTLTEMKRHHIKWKRRQTGSNADNKNAKTLVNQAYVDYLVDNKILNTNAVVNQPTFQKATNFYLSSFRVKANGKISKHNVGAPKTRSTRLRGRNDILAKFFKKLYKNKVSLHGNKKVYVDSKGNVGWRASTLKGKGDVTEEKVKNAATRGNVVDELVRLYFTSGINSNDFIQLGKDKLRLLNRQGGTDIEMSEKLFDDLYKILDQYADKFEKMGYTIYPNVPKLMAQLNPSRGEKGWYGGTIDLLAYDSKNRKYVLIDLKTTNKSRGKNYKTKNSAYKKDDLIQLNAYREMLRLKFGIEVDQMSIMSLTVPAADTQFSTYDKISIDTEGMLLDVSMKKDIYELYPFTGPKGSGRLNLDGVELTEGEDLAELDNDPETAKHRLKDDLLESILEAAGYTKKVKTPPKKGTTTTTKTPTKKASTKTTQEFGMKVYDAFHSKDNATSITQVYKGKYYEIIPEKAYIIERHTTTEKNFAGKDEVKIGEFKGFVTSRALSTLIVKTYNEEARSGFGMVEIDEGTFTKEFYKVSKKLTGVEVVKGEKVGKDLDLLDLSEIPEDKLDGITTQLLLLVPRNALKDLNKITKKLKITEDTPKHTAATAMIKFLLDKKISREEIIKKCKLG